MTVVIASVSSESSGESAHAHIARAFAVLCSHIQSMTIELGSGQTILALALLYMSGLAFIGGICAYAISIKISCADPNVNDPRFYVKRPQ